MEQRQPRFVHGQEVTVRAGISQILPGREGSRLFAAADAESVMGKTGVVEFGAFPLVPVDQDGQDTEYGSFAYVVAIGHSRWLIVEDWLEAVQ